MTTKVGERHGRGGVGRTQARARLRARILAVLTAGAGSMVLASTVVAPPAEAAHLPRGAEVTRRTDGVRAQWSKADGIGQPALQLAWWRNWGNGGWHPWWHNWPNWRNWHNWGNGGGGCQIPG
jgi:hypothetical protein